VQLYVERDGGLDVVLVLAGQILTSGFCGGDIVFIRSHSERFGIE